MGHLLGGGALADVGQCDRTDVDAFRAPVLAKVPKQFESKWGAGMFEKIQAVK